MERNILLTIEYDGTGFFGWQRQPKQPTIQGSLEKVLSSVLGKEVQINGAGRTDAGVHAYGQRANLIACLPLPTDRLVIVLNHKLAAKGLKKGATGPIRVLNAEEMPLEFHPRFDAAWKKYLYKISTKNPPDLFQRNYCYQLPESLDVDAMRRAAEAIVGVHDFKCFQSAGGEEKESTVRTVFSLEILQKKEGILIQIEGDGFLYNMVRIIAGTLVEAGQGKRSPEQISDIIDSKDRTKAGHTAPPQGLYLAEVHFEEWRGVEDDGRIKIEAAELG